MSDYTDRKLPRDEAPVKCVVHILDSGAALCGLGAGLFPGAWPPGHRWTYRHDLHNVTCEKCRAEAKKSR